MKQAALLQFDSSHLLRLNFFFQVWVPGYFIYYLLTTPGSLVERLKLGITPVIQPRADAVIAIEKQRMEQAQKTADLDVEMRLVADSSSTTDIVKSNHH